MSCVSIPLMVELSAQYPRYGYRRIAIFLDRDGHRMSFGRAHRLTASPLPFQEDRVKHRNTFYELAEIPRYSGIWRYTIYAKMEEFVSTEYYKTRERFHAAQAVCGHLAVHPRQHILRRRDALSVLGTIVMIVHWIVAMTCAGHRAIRDASQIRRTSFYFGPSLPRPWIALVAPLIAAGLGALAQGGFASR